MKPGLLRAQDAVAASPSRWGSLRLGGVWAMGLALVGRLGIAATSSDPAAVALGVPGQGLPSASSMAWNVDTSLRTAGGYHDNPRLSALNPAGSAFVSGGGDLVLLRLPIDGHEVSLFLSADHRSYVEPGFAAETIGVADLRYTRSWGDGWSAGGALEYFYLSQVFDASELEGVPAVVLAQGHLITVHPQMGWAFAPGWRTELDAELGRQWMAAPLDDYFDIAPRWTLVREYAPRSSVGLSYRLRERWFDDRTTLDDLGFSTEERLRYSQHEVELAWRHAWGRRQHWRTVLRPGWVRNVDNGSGYFDYERIQCVAGVRYSVEHWEARLEGRARWYRYPGQEPATASGTDRRRIDLSWTLRGEWKPRSWMRWFLQCELENLDENMPASDYRANALSVGLEIEM